MYRALYMSVTCHRTVTEVCTREVHVCHVALLSLSSVKDLLRCKDLEKRYCYCRHFILVPLVHQQACNPVHDPFSHIITNVCTGVNARDHVHICALEDETL
jgi:hypothetical protein